MQNLKIKVNNEAESKEVQELLFELGFGWQREGRTALCSDEILSKESGWLVFWGSPRFENAIIQIGCGSEDAKETTLAELRAMVKPKMKEYLMPSRNYEYILTDAREALEPHAKDWICIPDGANYAYKDESNVHFTKLEMGYRDLALIWVRLTQPEAMPFIDDEPQSLNEQYAEIEQVRQDGLKFDNGKPRHSLLPKGSIASIIAVLEFGAKKYEANNWQKVDNAKERYYDAAMRHIDSWWHGEKFDQETGIHHLAHAATNLLFLKWFDDKENNNG